MEELEFTWVQGRGEGFAPVRAIRTAVFVEEQGYSAEGEFDDQDADSLHILAWQEGRPLATARLFETEPGEYHIGRVAVLPAARGRRLGQAMMRQAVDRAFALGAACILLGAQYDKTHFYETLGFAPTGEKYLEEGYPHVMMRLARPLD